MQSNLQDLMSLLKHLLRKFNNTVCTLENLPHYYQSVCSSTGFLIVQEHAGWHLSSLQGAEDPAPPLPTPSLAHETQKDVKTTRFP